MNNKQITTACGFAMILNGMPFIATTASNESIKLYPIPPFVATDFLSTDEPSNYGSIKQKTDISLVKDIFSVKDVIQQADKKLGLSKQHLAQVFAVSRQNLYNLLNNAEQIPTNETENRAKQVNNALTVINSVCPYKLGASCLTVRIDGKRLFDVLTEGEICLVEVKKFAEHINKRITQQTVSTIPEQFAKQEEFLRRPNAV